MVMHRRRAGDEAGPSCDVDCPHEQAESLWLEALEVYGERARECAFLRTFGGVSSHQQNEGPSELRREGEDHPDRGQQYHGTDRDHRGPPAG